MAKVVKTIKNFVGTRKNKLGLHRPKFKSKKVEVFKSKGKENFSTYLNSLPQKDRAGALKTYIRGNVARTGSAAASSAATGISVGSGIGKQTLDTSSISNLSQNVEGGMSNSATHRDDDEGYDYPGVN